MAIGKLAKKGEEVFFLFGFLNKEVGGVFSQVSCQCSWNKGGWFSFFVFAVLCRYLSGGVVSFVWWGRLVHFGLCMEISLCMEVCFLCGPAICMKKTLKLKAGVFFEMVSFFYIQKAMPKETQKGGTGPLETHVQTCFYPNSSVFGSSFCPFWA